MAALRSRWRSRWPATATAGARPLGPTALLIGGIISIYSPAGLPWPAALLGLWVLGLLAIAAYRRQLGTVVG